MDTITDFSKLDLEELFELRELQAKMHANGQPEDLDRLTLDELKRLDRLYHKMANEPYSWERLSVYADENGKLRYKDNGDPYTWESEKRVRCHWCGHALALGAVTYTNDSVPGVFCSEQCLENTQRALQRRRSGVSAAPEPVAVAQAPAPAKPSAPATPAPAIKPVRPAEDVVSAARQLDSILRFGYDLPEEPR